VNTIPAPLQAQVSGSTLNLNWPADHTGWRLEVQTNALNAGLGTNWFPRPDSESTNAVAIPMAPGNPAVFFRLKYP
jgi:hypothetical protein